MSEPEKCPECDGAGMYAVDRTGCYGDWRTIICPACFGFGRVLSDSERAICRLMADRPEWARAVRDHCAGEWPAL